MRITRLTVEDFRSIRKVELQHIPSIAVFYGANGAGKSNVLAAIEVAWRILDHLAQTPDGNVRLTDRDRPFGNATANARFSMRVEFDRHAFTTGEFTTLAAEYDALVTGEAVTVRRLAVEGSRDERTVSATRDANRNEFKPGDAEVKLRDWQADLTAAVRGARLHVPEIRGFPSAGSPEGDVAQLALSGDFEAAAFKSLVSPDPELNARLDRLRQWMQGPPLARPPFRPVELSPGKYALQEVHSASRRHVGVPLAYLGLGIRQLYPIFGSIFLSGASIVSLEEPEAHLHERSTGRMLRELLLKLVPDPVSQLFLATHSEQFDLNPDGYFDVRYSEAEGTQVEWRHDLVDIDRRHTYSPGGARHALLDSLKRTERDQVVFTRGDGTNVCASEMVEMLIRDAPEAVDFLRLVTDAAVRAVSVKARRASGGA